MTSLPSASRRANERHIRFKPFQGLLWVLALRNLRAGPTPSASSQDFTTPFSLRQSQLWTWGLRAWRGGFWSEHTHLEATAHFSPPTCNV